MGRLENICSRGSQASKGADSLKAAHTAVFILGLSEVRNKGTGSVKYHDYDYIMLRLPPSHQMPIFAVLPCTESDIVR